MNNIDISERLKILTNNDLGVNLDIVIPCIKEKTEKYIHKSQSGRELNIKDLLNRESFDESYIFAQCLSILDYIEFLYSDKFKKIEVDRSLLMDFTRTFIFDFKYFNSFLMRLNLPKIYDPNEDETLTNIFMDRYVKSEEAFVAAKLTHYPGINSPLAYAYNKSIAPFIIRHAIELKIKCEMLGIDKVVYKNDKDIFVQENIGISRYIDFLQNEGSDFFALPSDVNIDDLREVNRWSNNYIHTGLYQYVWQVKSAILAIAPLFITEHDYEIRTFGFDFRAKDFSYDKLKDKLENKFSSAGKSLEFLMRS